MIIVCIHSTLGKHSTHSLTLHPLTLSLTRLSPVSCYLEIVDHESLPEGWCTLADFSFSVINQLEGTKKIVREGM